MEGLAKSAGLNLKNKKEMGPFDILVLVFYEAFKISLSSLST